MAKSFIGLLKKLEAHFQAAETRSRILSFRLNQFTDQEYIRRVYSSFKARNIKNYDLFLSQLENAVREYNLIKPFDQDEGTHAQREVSSPPSSRYDEFVEKVGKKSVVYAKEILDEMRITGRTRCAYLGTLSRSRNKPPKSQYQEFVSKMKSTHNPKKAYKILDALGIHGKARGGFLGVYHRQLNKD